MTLFLGYDPGGKGKHGVAAAEIKTNGDFKTIPKRETLRDANEVIQWLHEHKSAVAIGIDTLLAWSSKGIRACDDGLREHYSEHCRTVVQQNSLFSAMTINGALVACAALKMGFRLVESHPKLLRKVELCSDLEVEKLVAFCHTIEPTHEGDALIAAWCASRWHFGHWKVNLYEAISDGNLTFPAGEAVYPWPTQIGQSR